MDKAYLRNFYKEKRKQLLPLEREKLSLSILKQCIEHKIFNSVENIHVFLSSPLLMEVSTQPLIHYLRQNKKELLIPKVQGKNLLTCQYSPNILLKKSKWGILEPVSPIIVPELCIEMVIVPLLACDECGNRIGYGGGFYDRLLAKCSPTVEKIGINFFPPTTVQFPLWDTDIALNKLITPEWIYEF